MTPVKKHAPAISVVRARELRRNATAAEHTIERLLKANFPECRFRFQVPLRHYIVDFASHRAKVVVEIDGGQHSEEADAERSHLVEAEGYRIIRFWNNDVLQNGEGCMIRLAHFLGRDHPHPAATRRQAAKSSHPSPIKREEGR
ncbi:MAG: endonuclease domain-containing protein [Novosphingobium sp.]